MTDVICLASVSLILKNPSVHSNEIVVLWVALKNVIALLTRTHHVLHACLFDCGSTCPFSHSSDWFVVAFFVRRRGLAANLSEFLINSATLSSREFSSLNACTIC